MLQGDLWMSYAGVGFFAAVSLIVGWRVEGKQAVARVQRARLRRLQKRDEEKKRKLFG